MTVQESKKLFERAQKVIPGGVNSPVRAFRAVGGVPRFIAHADGSHITDTDGNTYIDYVGSWGPMLLGHNHPVICEAIALQLPHGLSYGAPTALEVEMAEKIVDMVPGIEMVRMVNSGTEAVMSAIRLARGATGRQKIIKFAGCYHGHSDAMLVKAGSGVLTEGHPDSNGVTEGAAQDTLIASYNDLDSVEKLFDANMGYIAAVIVEPVAANMGVIAPKEGFLEGLRELCSTHGALLIFDEVITGFRLAKGGAMAYFGVQADLVTYGKIIGGGMPVGAYAGKRELMELVAPCGTIYQAGTLSGNPVAMAAGIAQLTYLDVHSEVYDAANAAAQRLETKMSLLCEAYDVPMTVQRVGSLLCPYFCTDTVWNYETARLADTKRYAEFFHLMLSQGVYLAPSQFEAMFVSAAHSEQDIAETIDAIENAFKQMQ